MTKELSTGNIASRAVIDEDRVRGITHSPTFAEAMRRQGVVADDIQDQSGLKIQTHDIARPREAFQVKGVIEEIANMRFDHFQKTRKGNTKQWQS